MLETMKKHNWSHELKNWGFALLGASLYVFGMKCFLQPANLYNAGTTGLAQIIDTIFFGQNNISFGGLDAVGLLYFVFNAPLLILAYRSRGRDFFSKTLFSVIYNSILMSLLPRLEQPFVDDTLTACLISAIIIGFGSGLILRAGGSNGGLDILGVYMTKKFKFFTIGKLSLMINALIYTACSILFDIQTAIFSIIYVTFLSFIVDKTYTQIINVESVIITKSDGRAISQYIMDEFERGVTYWNGTGAYTREGVTVLYAILSKYEAGILTRDIKTIDAHAFIVLKEGTEVIGEFPRHMCLHK